MWESEINNNGEYEESKMLSQGLFWWSCVRRGTTTAEMDNTAADYVIEEQNWTDMSVERRPDSCHGF